MKRLLLFCAVVVAVIFSLSRCGDGLCTGDCTPAHLNPQSDSFQHTVFVTSLRTSGNTGGLAGADEICRQLASKGEKTKDLPGTWRAILSDTSTDTKSRLALKTGAGIVNSNGEQVVENSDALWNGSLAAPIQYDENGTTISAKLEVWSGSLANGTRASGPSLVTTCTDWNDGTTVSNGGQIGNLSATNQTWLQGDDWIGCAKTDEKARLYCINSL